MYSDEFQLESTQKEPEVRTKSKQRTNERNLTEQLHKSSMEWLCNESLVLHCLPSLDV